MSGTEEGRAFAASAVVAGGGPVQPPWDDELVSCVVDENVGLPDVAVLTYRDGSHEMLEDTGITLGSPLEVSVASARTNAKELLFRGEVTSIELEVDGTGSYTVLRAMNRAHRLLRGRRVEAFHQMSATAIIRKVAKNAGLTAGKVEAAPITYQHISQAGVSDWDFLQTLAREHGALVRVDDKGVLDFVKPQPASKAPAPTTSAEKSPYVLEYGRNLMALRAVLGTSEQTGGVEVRGWNQVTKTEIVATRKPQPSKTVVPGLLATKAAKLTSGGKLLAAGTPYATQAEADAAAKALEESLSAGYGELEAVVEGNPQLRAGVPIALGNVGAAFSGRYTATAVTHVIEPNRGYRTTVLVSASADRSFAGLVAHDSIPSRGPRMPGLAIAEVTDIKETGNGERGWVRLRFPWLDDKYVSDWVRTVQLGGVAGGGVFSPDVKDEVLVGFEQGSLDRPYVLGGLYNGIDKPSKHDQKLVDGRSGKVNRRSLVNRKGDRLELLDGTAAQGVRLGSGDDELEVVLDRKKNELRLVRGGRVGGCSITLSRTGVEIDAGRGGITLKAGGKVDVSARTGVDIDTGFTGDVVVKGRTIRLN